MKNFSWLFDMIFPSKCLGCNAEGSFLCNICKKTILTLSVQTCPYCLSPSVFGKTCFACRNHNFLDGLLVFSAFQEHSLLQKCIHQLKYDFITGLAEPLGGFLYQTLLPFYLEQLGNFILCPIPLHVKRERWRGFNQSSLLCKELLCRIYKFRHTQDVEMLQLLERTRFTKAQMELHREERLKNMEGAFRPKQDTVQQILSKNLKAPTVVLVDDIATTLSTLENAAKALKDAGFNRVYGLVLARVF